MTTSVQQYVDHRVRDGDASSSHSSSSAYWYPLSHLSRWSGAVAPDAEANVVKKFMAVAKKAVEAKYQAQGADSVIRKIGNVLCVSEDGFVASVDAWAQVCPSNQSLIDFQKQLPQITQQVFHTAANEAAVTSAAPVSSPSVSTSSSALPSSAPTLSESSLALLRSKYAFDSPAAGATTSTSSVGRLPQASLAAPSNQFSLGAFLDQHLQLSSNSKPGSASATSAAAASTHSLQQFRTDLAQLQRAVNQQLAVCKVQNPPKVKEESERVQVYSDRLQSLSASHSLILQQLESHLAASKPLHEMVEHLSANMAFIQRVQLYETLVRQALEWSEKCRDALTVQNLSMNPSGQMSPPSDKAGPNGGFAAGFNNKDAALNGGLNNNNDMNLSASSLDAKQLQHVCSMFLKLLRIYQGLQQSTLNFPSSSDSASAQQWKGVENLQGVLRTRIQSLLAPLRKRMIALYQHTLTSLHWPQTNTSLLLGMNGTGALERRAQKGAGRTDGADAIADKTDINASPTSASPPVVTSPSPIAVSPIDSTLALFELLTESLVRLQMLIVECGLDEENHLVEREIQGWRTLENKAKLNKGARLWVLTLLLQPIYKRFYFHFDTSNPTVSDLSSSSNSSGADSSAAGADPSLTQNSLTNRLDKPEWVCTFLEKTYRDHYEFLDRIIQPIVNRCKFTNAYERDWSEWNVAPSVAQHEEEKEKESGEGPEEDEMKSLDKVVDSSNTTKLSRQELLLRSSSMDVYEFSMEFLERLLSFYHAKLNRPSTLNILLSSPGLLRHTLHELVNFETKLNQVYNYPIHSSRRLSLLDPFLKSDDNFAVVLRLEKERINRSLEELRTLPHPWEPLLEHKLKKSSRVDKDSDSEVDEEEEENESADAAPSTTEETGVEDENAHFLSSSLTSATSASSLCATVSAHSFLSLIDSLSARSRSFKYLNIRLQILKEIQFKLFEIYEEDFIRTSQENWTKLLENVAASSKKQNGVGGLNSLRILTKNNRSILVAPKGASSSDSNPLQLWQTHCGLLNSIEYIVSILREWNDDFLYLELYYFYTHKAKIQQSMLAAYQAAHQPLNGKRVALPTGAATPIGGYYVKHHDGEEEVYITSEELALWIAQGGQVPLDSATIKAEVDHKSTNTNSNVGSAAAGSTTDATASVDASKPYLPPRFQQTLNQLSSLSTLISSGSAVAKSSPRESEPLLTSPLAGSSSTYAPPTSDSLFPKSTLEARESAANARASKLQAAASTALPMDLSIQGTMFSPILAGYNSLGDDMMHSLVNVVVNHFRDGIRKSQYTTQGHMSRDHSFESHAAAFLHPALDSFFAHDRDEQLRTLLTADGAPFDYSAEHVDSLEWDLLDHHIDISQGLCQPLLDLKMQLIVVHQSLTKSLHRAFCSSVMNKLNQILFDDLVVGQYFTRNGSLQFLRDMRAIFTIFRVYYPMTVATASAGNERSTTFRLVQDTMNLLVLSPRARQYLLSELQSGSLASATPTIVKQALLQPPFYITRMNPDQVISVLEHMRVESHRKQSQPEQDVDDGADVEETPVEEDDYADESPRYDAQDDEEADAEVEALASDDAAEQPQDSAEAVAYEEGDKIADMVHDDEIADELAEASPEESPEDIPEPADDANEEEVEEPNLDDFEGFPEEQAEVQPEEEGESVVLQ